MRASRVRNPSPRMVGMFRIETTQSASNGHTHCAGLTDRSSTIDTDQHIDRTLLTYCFEWFEHLSTGVLSAEIFFERTIIDLDFSVTSTNANTATEVLRRPVAKISPVFLSFLGAFIRSQNEVLYRVEITCQTRELPVVAPGSHVANR